jgi:hypothetical protein
MRNFIDIVETAEPVESKMSFWDLVAHYDFPEDFAEYFEDLTLPWINRNVRRGINEAVKDPQCVLWSKIELFMKLHGPHDFNEPFCTVREFELSMTEPVTLWRGGGGVFDPALDRPWVSFTANRRRANTFSKYEATKAAKVYRLPTRIGPWWITEVSVPLGSILLYLRNGQDHEVIISRADAASATVIETGVGS